MGCLPQVAFRTKRGHLNWKPGESWYIFIQHKHTHSAPTANFFVRNLAKEGEC